MQGKGIIKTLFFLLLAVTLYQIFLYYPTNNAEKECLAKATDIANGNEVIQDSIYKSLLDSITDEPLLNIPLVGNLSYAEVKKQQMGLGLDLKGGMSAVLQVDLKEYLFKQSDSNADPRFQTALENAQKGLTGSQSDYLTLFGQEWAKVADGASLGEIFITSDAYSDKIGINTTDTEILNILREDTKKTVNQTYNMLLQRIDRMGVVQPNVTLDEARDLILVELPGIENPKLAADMLEGTANLQFWKTYTAGEINSKLFAADQELKKEEEARDTTSGEVEMMTIDTLMPKLDDSGQPVLDSAGQVVMEQTQMEVPANFNSVDPRGPLSRLLTMGGMDSRRAAIGLAGKRDRDEVLKILESPQVKAQVPPDVKFYFGAKPIIDDEGVSTGNYMLYAIKEGYDKQAPLEGDIVKSARTETDPTTGQVGVNLDMKGDGPQVWCQLTTEAFNQGEKPIAIILDGEVVSAPSVNGAICQGSSRISGGFSVLEAQNLATKLEIGALPASPRIIQQAEVGPTLGQKNINRSLTALGIGFVLVLLFMIAYYSGGGIISIIALLTNLLFIFGALSNMGNVLTLPGIAGIVLTIGMAVDANVIIFERIREELREGKSLLVSVADGFSHSYSAIIDANVTTILVALVLLYFGMGPIKGFASVLIVGVIMSVFTAVLLGRLIIDWWTVSRGKDMGFWMGWSKNFLSNLSVDWLAKRKIAYGISAVIIIAGLISMFTVGFDYGVDFTGGYSYTVEIKDDKTYTAAQIKDALKVPFDGEPVVKTFDSANTFSITTKYLSDQQGDGTSEKVFAKLHEGINGLVGGNLKLSDFENAKSSTTKVISSNIVGPTIADDIRKSSIWATIVALLFIFTYIFIRFRKWQFSLGAVAALFHDVLIVLSVFSIGFAVGLPFSLEIDQAFIAALLTVVGYSINDTVVVFDRIREFLNKYVGRSKDEVINMAVNSTVSRTVITSLTTLFVVLILFIFGSGSIKGFAFALVVGILVGTYSSVFIATPIVHDSTKDLTPKKPKKKSQTSTLARKQAQA